MLFRSDLLAIRHEKGRWHADFGDLRVDGLQRVQTFAEAIDRYAAIQQLRNCAKYNDVAERE